TNYPDSTIQLTNPTGATDPEWIHEDDMTEADWHEIQSFKLELTEHKDWIKGENIDINFKMIMPDENDLSEELLNCETVIPQQRAAWNSFAVATDEGQPVEPERVGVAVECVDVGELESEKLVDKEKAY